MAIESLGKALIYIGVITALVGAFMMFLSKVHWFGRLPGDISIERGGWTIIVPITTMIIVSIVITLVINIVLRK
jgi:uncharacterized membrane-anchored protein